MTQHDDPLIQGMPLSRWEYYMTVLDDGNDPPFRGIRVETDSRGERMVWREYLPTNPDLGLHQSGRRQGARITLVDLGWSVETVRGTR